MSNSTSGPTHPVNPTRPGPTAGRPDYSGGRWQVFFSRIQSGQFSLKSSPQNPKKPEPTDLYSIFQRDFLDPVRFQLDPWNLHRIWRDLIVYVQIQLQSNGFCSNKAQISWQYVGFAQIRLRSVENMMGFAQIRQNSDGICSNPATIWCIFAQISWVLQKSGDYLMFFCLDLVIFAQILRRSGEKYSRRQNGISGSIIVSFDWFDLTRWCLRLAAGFLARNPMSSGRFRVGHKLNPDQPVDTPT